MRGLLALLLGAIAFTIAVPTGTGATKPVASYCSPSGDVCYAIVRRSGAVYLELTTFTRYFLRYRLCVKPPRGVATCRSFPMRRSGQFYKSAVLWHKNYPGRGAGRYVVTWKLEQPLGPTLAFRLP